jgi:catalase-peroxidase
MTVLIGGVRALGPNANQSDIGILTATSGELTNDFFVNLLDMSTQWTATDDTVFEGRDRESGEIKWTAAEVDLIFGSNSVLRAIAEVYASDDAEQQFVDDFIAPWVKAMNLDRFDLS